MPALALEELENSAAKRYAHGYVLELATRQLSVRGLRVHVEPKVFDLIGLLVEQRHRVMSRHELNARLWSGERVCAGALTQAVWSARQLLRDSPQQARFISTAHRWGYRFIGRVEPWRHSDGTGALLLLPAADAASLPRL